MTLIKPLPQKDYYAVIFISERSENLEGYHEMDILTIQLAEEIPGYLGYESVKDGNKGIFISYWESMDSINQWKNNLIHQQAKSKAKQWYKSYISQICKVELTSSYVPSSHVLRGN